MTEVVESTPAAASTDTDLVAAVHVVLQGSEEPLTLSKIRAHLPMKLRQISLEELAESLRRQVAANALYQYPKYRSQQDRFWDRPMPVHVASLLRATLEAGPLAWSELRRKLPAYAQGLAEPILQEQIAQGLLHRHPRASTRSGERFGVRPPDAQDYLRPELIELFGRLEKLGFRQNQLRESALELLHEEEWASAPTTAEQPPQTSEPAATAAHTPAVEQAETHPETPDAGSQP